MKTGRNDPCPCGSGKKYKKCCLGSNIIPFPETIKQEDPEEGISEKIILESSGFSDRKHLDASLKDYQEYCEEADRQGLAIPSFMEFQGQPNMASSMIENMREELSDQDFNSLDEANAFLRKKMDRQNSRGLEDFLGLSSLEMQRILSGDFSSNEFFVTLNSKIAPKIVVHTRIVREAELILRLMKENGGFLPTTPKGNLKRNICNRIYQEFHDDISEGLSIRGEDELGGISLLRLMLEDLELTTSLKTKVLLTAKGKQMLDSRDWGSLYLGLFKIFLDHYSWLDPDVFINSSSLIQDAALFSLYILKKKAPDFIDFEELYSYFEKAFPMIKNTPNLRGGMNIMPTLYETYFISGFCVYFGLIETNSDIDGRKISQYRTSKLFNELLLWK